jgi:hypothetical protein
MTKKIVLGAAIALVIVGIASTPASALCNPPKNLLPYNAGSARYIFWNTGLPNAGTTLIGNVWSGTVNHTGTCNADQQGFVYFGGEGQIGLNFNLGDACVVGCPSGAVSVQVTAINGAVSKTLTSQVPETSVGGVNFDFSVTAAHDLGDYPRQHVTASSRVGTNVNVNVGVDAASGIAFDGSAGQITGYNILSASSPTDPGRLASAYTLRTNIPAPGGIAATGATPVDCTNINNDQWVVTQLVTTGGPSNTVSPATRIKCNPALANPKYNIVPKKSMGTQTQH